MADRTPPPTARRRALKKRYNPEPLRSRVEQLLADAQRSGREPQRADHFDLNPNEFLELAGHPPLKIFEVKAANAERLPREAIDVAMALARLSNPRTRKAVSAAILALLQQFFEE